MKIEYCEITIKNPCNDQKYCCPRFRDFNRTGQIMIYDGRFCLWDNDTNLARRVMVPIDYCMFCGEKIEN